MVHIGIDYTTCTLVGNYCILFSQSAYKTSRLTLVESWVMYSITFFGITCLWEREFTFRNPCASRIILFMN